MTYPDVYCPHCAKRGMSRYIGAFVGKGQCATCKTWTRVDSEAIADESSTRALCGVDTRLQRA